MPITTIPFSARKAGPYLATAGQTEFSFGFPVLAAGDLTVSRERAGTVTQLVLNTHYTVNGVGEQSGGAIVLTSGALEGDIIAIDGTLTPQRSTSFVGGTPFRTQNIDTDLNRLAVMVQELAREVGRAVRRRAVDENAGSLMLPIDVTETQLLALNAAGEIVGRLPADLDLSVVSPFAATLLDDASAAEARGTLELDDIIPVAQYGAVGDGIADDGPALQAALDAADGRTVRLKPGHTYRIATAVVTRGKSWTLDARGADIHVDANVPAIAAYADIDNLQAVSSISGAEVTVSDGLLFAAGDLVRVISEDTPTNARDVSSGDTYKSGELGIVESIAGDVLTLQHSLTHGSEMVTTPRIFRIPTRENVNILGGNWYYTEGHDATPWAANCIMLFGIVNPRIEGVSITRCYSGGLVLIGTYGATVVGHRGERHTDNTVNGQFGYVISDAGVGTTIVGVTGDGCRHVVTTNPLRVPADTTDEDQLHKYGHCIGLRVLGGVCLSAASTAFDTHHSTENVFMTGLFAQKCTSAVGVRAQGARIIGVEARDISEGVINIFSDNTDTPATEDGWTADVYVDGVYARGAYLLRAARAVNVHLSNIKATLTEWQVFQCVDAQVFLHGDVTLVVNDTATTHAGRGVLDSDQAEASGFTPSIEQVSGRLRVSGSGSSGSTTFAGARADGSSITIREALFIFPNGSVGNVLITANGGAIAADLKFDISGSGESGMTKTSGSNITATIESNDQSNDQNNLNSKARQPLTWAGAHGDPTTATIASGVITATSSFMTVDTESAGATDDLDTINGGINGDILVLRTANSARDITVRNGTGNITCGVDRVLDSITDRIVLQNTNGTAWVMLAIAGDQGAPISNVATGGSATAAANATAINSILAAIRTHGVITV